MTSITSSKRFQKIVSFPGWALVAAFGTYFCMYGFRKPYTAATYADAEFFGINYKILLIIAQTLGYVIAKWVGIKFVSEIKREQRVKAILFLIGFAELMLLMFGIVPRPWNIICLLLNGLPLRGDLWFSARVFRGPEGYRIFSRGFVCELHSF